MSWRRFAVVLTFLPVVCLAVVPGEVDTSFASVGSVGGGSGVAIGPWWVLTAKHIDGSTFSIPEFGTFSVTKDYANPIADLRLLRVDRPLPVYTSIDWGDAMGRRVTLVGFGDTGTLRSDGSGYDPVTRNGVRHSGMNRIDGVDTVSFGVWPNQSWQTWRFTLDGPTEATIATGDSGGGWFVKDGDRQKLVAISDATDAPQGKSTLEWGATGYGVKLNDPRYRGWIETVTAHNHPVPEPATVFSLFVGIAGIVLRRTRAGKNTGT